ncbi:MAG TPA: hypothetical protein VGZ00_08170 [Candidatus Baltobacteraceae bacterium]|jgi:hypothetical protein|nr:hypothetical protein [Candidatus Baltobacteraceae bacterium]
MENEIAIGDDYLEHINSALEEAKRAIDSAATVFVQSAEAQQHLGESLGRASNAVARARRDLNAHVAREIRRSEHSAAEKYFADLRLAEDEHTKIVVAIVPLPLEEERISPNLFAQQHFLNDFSIWLTRFNSEERRGNALAYLMAIPGGLIPSVESEQVRFSAVPSGGTEPSQVAHLYPTGAFVFKHRISWGPQTTYRVGLVIDDLRATIKFAWRVYEELHIVPKCVAIQCALTNVANFTLRIASDFEETNELTPNEGLTNIITPTSPIVLPFNLDEALTRVTPRIESEIRANYHSA